MEGIRAGWLLDGRKPFWLKQLVQLRRVGAEALPSFMADPDTAAMGRTGTGHDGATFCHHKRSALQRRAQRSRAEARTVVRLVKGFHELNSHRGCQLSRIGFALAQVFSQIPDDSPQHQQHSQQQQPPAVCRHFITGRCTWGESCRFAHPATPEQQQQQQQTQQQAQQQPFVSPWNTEAPSFAPFSVQPVVTETASATAALDAVSNISLPGDTAPAPTAVSSAPLLVDTVTASTIVSKVPLPADTVSASADAPYDAVFHFSLPGDSASASTIVSMVPLPVDTASASTTRSLFLCQVTRF